MLVRRILHPTDFSELGQVALPYLEEMAKLYGAEVHFLHVLEPLVATTDFTWTGLNQTDVESKREGAAQQALEEAVSATNLEPSQVRQAVERGKSHDVIRDYAEEHDIDLIVIATHGHTGLTHLLLGSTAEMVVRTARCPVLSVKRPSDAE